MTIAGALSDSPQWRPGCPVLVMSLTDTRVSVSGSGRLQSPDAALCLTGTGPSPGTELKRTKDRFEDVQVSLCRPTNAILEALPEVWTDLTELHITGEQWQHLHTGFAENDGRRVWYIVLTLPQWTSDKVLCC